MKSTEDAYFVIGNILHDVASIGWKSIFIKTKILEKSCSNIIIVQTNDKGMEIYIDLEYSILRLATNAIRFLRENLLETTGQRIWGLTFTLFPDGKFKIEYDYNKPKGYEETDEVIDGNEINQSLQNLMKNKEPLSPK